MAIQHGRIHGECVEDSDVKKGFEDPGDPEVSPSYLEVAPSPAVDDPDSVNESSCNYQQGASLGSLLVSPTPRRRDNPKAQI